MKGCSVSHLLADLWDEILWNLEDDRAATTLTAIDYSKAFNRLSFQHCLKAFSKKGASSSTIALLATFLSNRTMSVRVGQTWSEPRPVYGGVPQGSILGVLLFNISTDDLEDEEEHDPCTFIDEDSDSWEGLPSPLDALPSREMDSSAEWPAAPSSSNLPDSPLSTDSESSSEGGPVEGLATSTPMAGSRGRPRLRESPLIKRGPRLTVRDWSFMPGRSNRRRRRNLQRKIRVEYSDEREQDVPAETNRRATGFRWKPSPAKKKKYVDDGIISAKVNMQTAPEIARPDILAQNMFRRVVDRARDRGTVVNDKKDKNSLCIRCPVV